LERLRWRARTDFSSHTLSAEVTLEFAAGRSGPVDLDTRGLDIESVRRGSATDDTGIGAELPFTLAEPEPILGQRLRVELPEGERRLHIRYRTRPDASALQWLSPAQTSGQHPFLYSQCQAIHARSVIPLQDTPRVRIRYEATLEVPEALTALMAADALSRKPLESGWVAFSFRIEEPIPPYLLAFAVGHLRSADLGPRSRVWAEPEVVDAAAYEFARVEELVRSAEQLLGAYDWGRFDLLLLPAAFPYGGMENPKLTFLTPTLIAGDRSLVDVVAHELSHSWTGNLVSNASAEHFWLNEGFTVFVERKILAAVEGREAAELHAAIGRRALEDAFADFKDHPELTQLRTRMSGLDPDEVFSSVPYEKGCLFLRALEESVGEAAFAQFLKRYMARFRFQSITTDEMLEFVRVELPGALERIDAPSWIDAPGLPKSAPIPRSSKLDAIVALGQQLPKAGQARAWSPAEWQVYLGQLKPPLSSEQLRELDEQFKLTASTNYEVLVGWLAVALRSGYAPAVSRTEKVLGQVGRSKYLRALYGALCSRAETRPLARTWLDRYRASYHAIAVQRIEAFLQRQGA
jgi:aminopeptidase N